MVLLIHRQGSLRRLERCLEELQLQGRLRLVLQAREVVVPQPLVLVLQVLLDLPLLHHLVSLRVDVQGLLVQALPELVVPLALALLPEFEHVLQRVDVDARGLLLGLLLLVLCYAVADRVPLALELLHPLLPSLLEVIPQLPQVVQVLLVAEMVDEVPALLAAFVVDHPKELLDDSHVEHRSYKLLDVCRSLLELLGDQPSALRAVVDDLLLLQPQLLLVLQPPLRLVRRFGVRPAHEFVPEGLRVHGVHGPRLHRRHGCESNSGGGGARA
mmetsp:Transcript_6319/g.16954  ORF Transcript_6319/g.16954 Transcript_6319/m.16954 type:complete len:271 (+) Transcript_6319:896-1708(+)